jgi:phospholipase/carboxylesterase
MALSAYLLLAEKLAGEASEANRGVPIFQAHGLYDPLVAVDLGRTTRDRLQEDGYGVEWCEYSMEHQVCPQEIEDVGRWLRRVLRATAASPAGSP